MQKLHSYLVFPDTTWMTYFKRTNIYSKNGVILITRLSVQRGKELTNVRAWVKGAVPQVEVVERDTSITSRSKSC